MRKELLNTTVYSGTTVSQSITAEGFTGGLFFLDYSAGTGTVTSFTVALQSYDKTSDKWVLIPGASWAAVSTTTTLTLSVHPAITAAANVAVSQLLGGTVRARVVGLAIGAASATLKLSAVLVR
jgi:uncharacterized membrane protein required for colicin V production